jgi:hypothetical protein
MRLPASILAVATAFVVTMPAAAQDNLITLGAFVTVRAEHVPQFEQQVRNHNEWHASQNDPQLWATYQAITGHGEYALLAPGMTWASMDTPALDMGADIAHWAESGAPYTQTEEFVLWTDIPGGNPPADPGQFPVIQVYDFAINSGGQAAAIDAIARASEALAQTGIHFQWSTVVSRDGPPGAFLALWFQSFAGRGTPGPGADQVMADAFGAGEGARILAQFAEATTALSSQIWTFRPDLSYTPAM